MEKSWYFIQLSDTHIVAATHQEFHGVNTYETLSRAITQISRLDPPPAPPPLRPTIFLVPHPPVPTGIDWLDAHTIANSTELLEVLAKNRQVRRVFFGHVHMPLHITAHGVQFTSVPSTCYQFGDLVVTPKVFAGPPGYGVVVLQDERVSSRVTYF